MSVADRDAAPAEPPDDSLRVFVARIASTRCNHDDATCERWIHEARVLLTGDAVVGHDAPAAAELKPGAENFNSDGGDEGDFNSPAPAAPREGYLTALDRLEAWRRNIEGATSLPYAGWQDDLMIVLRLAREAARGEVDTNGL